MRRHGQTSAARKEWSISLVLILAGAAYISLFWGKTAELLPTPLDGWGRLVAPTIRALGSERPVLWCGIHMVVGIAVPGCVLRLFGRGLTDAGMGLPNALGRRMILVSAIVSIPFGLWLLSGRRQGSVPGVIDLRDVCALMAMIPEHFLICGTCVAVLLPGRRLPDPVAVAPVTGQLLTKAMRWLGLAQPVGTTSAIRLLSWFGLTSRSLFAILASGAFFGMVHVGKDDPLELVLSFPGGVAVAYITLRSHSIWPAIIAHWVMNIIPWIILMVR